MFSYAVDVKGSMEQVLNRLEKIIEENKLRLLWKYDIATKLFEQGIQFTHPYYILELSHEDLTKRLLTEHPESGFLLPAKCMVYQDEERDVVRIGVLRPTVLAEEVDNEQVKVLAQQLEEKLIEMVNQCTAEEKVSLD
ncbi:DUF302 domain-containing protein [Thermoactinomyces mirandus]|uniref:DUF302 domain-containing protein n=1 Tax=Thermoactinomyces mirandus TaxID=2756294 RepID=A0A7W1XUY7_9BACL|nr:DUF302 domain-containing protein [Thermoactinomyces mirandus]MBA4603527.1 DUF302 domain-containing protein [Thermoactinomyces mirandus]